MTTALYPESIPGYFPPNDPWQRKVAGCNKGCTALCGRGDCQKPATLVLRIRRGPDYPWRLHAVCDDHAPGPGSAFEVMPRPTTVADTGRSPVGCRCACGARFRNARVGDEIPMHGRGGPCPRVGTFFNIVDRSVSAGGDVMGTFEQRLWDNGGLLADACFFRHDGSLGRRLEPGRVGVLSALWRWLELPLRRLARVRWHPSVRWAAAAPLPWCLFCEEPDEGYGLHHRMSCLVRAAESQGG